MRISREKGTLNIYLDGQKLERIDSFKYLGTIIADDGYCSSEVKYKNREVHHSSKEMSLCH